MTGRAPTNTVTCSGTPTGAVMTYDAERRLATWQNQPSNPTSTAAYWYDGEGHRVAQTYNGVTTYYLGDDEEITGSTLLKYYHIPGLPVLGTIVGVTRTYLASDGLGSESVDLSYNGSVLAQALYGPYGVGRYATGTMPSSKGYTGQRQDSGSGLDYYNARYYDASVGQFSSADSVQGPNRYGYVGGNPETANDPTGTRLIDPEVTQLAGITYSLIGFAISGAGAYARANAAVARARQAYAQYLIDARKAAYRDVHGTGDIPHRIRRGWENDVDAATQVADDADAAAKASTEWADAAGKWLIAGGAVVDGLDAFQAQWSADGPVDGLGGFGWHLMRATTAGVVHGFLSTGVGVLGAVVGDAGGTILGTATGGVVGAVVGGVIGSFLPGAGTIAGAILGAEIGSDIGGAIGGLAGGFAGAVDLGNQLSDTVSNITNDAVNTVSNAVSDLFSW